MVSIPNDVVALEVPLSLNVPFRFPRSGMEVSSGCLKYKNSNKFPSIFTLQKKWLLTWIAVQNHLQAHIEQFWIVQKLLFHLLQKTDFLRCDGFSTCSNER